MSQSVKMERYYRFHANIYQATRWTFLFGRKPIFSYLPINADWEGHIVEVGCGTGHNLACLAEKFPYAQLTGIDIARPMLDVARKKLSRYGDRIRLTEADWNTMTDYPPVDIAVFSYCLTMINPGWDAAIEHAMNRLSPEGYIAVVDFHATGFGWFERWMGFNHVRMQGHLLPVLEQKFRRLIAFTPSAYGGWWQYLMFIGQKKDA